MIHPDIQAMLVRERSATLMAAAAAYRRGRQARSAAMTVSRAAANRTAPDQTTERGQVVPRDGSAVLIRPLRGAGAPLLADGFARLSERSRRLRFLGRKRTLTEADLRFFTDVDHHDHEALGALDHVRGGGVAHRGSGIAEYENDLDGTSSRAD
jgi:hypothetical protein